MEKITKDISEIIAGEIKTINDKVRGLNFLELLKSGIIEKLLELVNRQKFPIDQLIEYQNEIKEVSLELTRVGKIKEAIEVTFEIEDYESLFFHFNEMLRITINRSVRKLDFKILESEEFRKRLRNRNIELVTWNQIKKVLYD